VQQSFSANKYRGTSVARLISSRDGFPRALFSFPLLDDSFLFSLFRHQFLFPAGFTPPPKIITCYSAPHSPLSDLPAQGTYSWVIFYSPCSPPQLSPSFRPFTGKPSCLLSWSQTFCRIFFLVFCPFLRTVCETSMPWSPPIFSCYSRRSSIWSCRSFDSLVHFSFCRLPPFWNLMTPPPLTFFPKPPSCFDSALRHLPSAATSPAPVFLNALDLHSSPVD